jgi:ABC-2 type transport system permease protein
MERVLTVVRREYLERVRSKAFIVGTVLGPLLMAGLMVLPTLIMSRQRGGPLRVAVLDATGTLGASVEKALAARRAAGTPRFAVQPAPDTASLAEAETALKQEILAGRLDGFVKLPADVLESSRADYYGKNVSNLMDLRLVDRAVEEAVVGTRLGAEGLSAARIEELTRALELRTFRVSPEGEREDRGSGFIFSVILLMLLYTAVLMWGQAILTGVIEEKTNRVVEVVVSSLSSTQLFLGKLLGVGAAGLTQLAVWVACLGVAGAYAASSAGAAGMSLPPVTPLLLASFPVFFLLGFFLYGTFYAAIGALVNTVQEAQNFVFPVLVPLILSLMFFGAVIESPDSTLSVVLSLVPFMTPLLMFLRITVLPPPAWQILLSILLTGLTVLAVLWVAARIYRVGILMYGKRPTFTEIARWVRHP